MQLHRNMKLVASKYHFVVFSKCPLFVWACPNTAMVLDSFHAVGGCLLQCVLVVPQSYICTKRFFCLHCSGSLFSNQALKAQLKRWAVC